ncbi:hypothetical protein QFC21_005572 [Naganishia friedmannii]|uniref:Uncharacterized protein n=1 Tax=Naganishia friedmannii TaxID=89922 RepID=A0ACC2V9V0_9TREE|nr:hypothetical protein QFC21_005572 [Naganishia friedmannii]
MSEAISLEETNRIRAELGLKPIGGPTVGVEEGGIEDPDSVAERNFQERMDRERRERQEKETRERIAKAKNQRALNAKLRGSTLGEAAAEEDAESTASWIKKNKKMQKQRAREIEMARQRELEQEERDRGVYDEDDLSGLKVAHGEDAFAEGEDVILTLKDNRILDGDAEDELQNVNLADDEALRRAKERKKKAKAQYTGYDDEEFEEGSGSGVGQKRSVLSKYDDDDFLAGAGGGVGFRLGGQGERKRVKVDKMEDGEETINLGVNKQLMNMDYNKNFDISDYATEDTTFKKKKKKVKRSTRKADVGEGETEQVDENGDGDVEMKPAVQLNREVDENLVDDDELQLALARQRRKVTKRVNRVRPEDIASQVMESHRAEQQDAVAEEAGVITFDDTSEFVRNVSLDNLQVKREPREARSESIGAAGPSMMPVVKEEPTDEQAPIVVKIETADEPLGGYDVEMGDAEEEDEEDEALAEMALRQGLSLEEMRIKMDAELQERNAVKEEEDEFVITKPEPTMSGGMGGVLAMLRQQGAIKTLTVQDAEKERVQREKDLWLADHRRRMAKRELEKIKARGGPQKDQAQREWENKMREQQEAREALESYKSYKPDVNIAYTDEFGRVMTAKEAWKSLSHKFHGKTSGRMKTEKRLQKIDEERKRMAMAMSDTPSGMIDAFNRRQEKTGEAFMTLSVGNRSYVPMAEDKGQAQKAGQSSRGKGRGNANAGPSKTSKKLQLSGPKVLG